MLNQSVPFPQTFIKYSLFISIQVLITLYLIQIVHTFVKTSHAICHKNAQTQDGFDRLSKERDLT